MASRTTDPGAPQPTRAWDRGEVIGAAVLAFAGIAWFGWAQADPPASWVPYLVAGSALSALALVALVWLLMQRRATTGAPMADPRIRRGYWVTVAVEVVLIAGGNLLLAAVGNAAYQAAWTLFVVGVHSIPLGRVFQARGLVLTGVVVALVAVIAAVVSSASRVAPSATAGAGGGIVFIGYAGWVLAGGRRRHPQSGSSRRPGR